MTPPLVTIGIPCFNAEAWIATCVRSALAQNWQAVEVIVADDGSADRSLEILREFGGQITLVNAPHRGANHARNAILRAARGEWIQYLDADDFLLREKVSQQLEESGGGLGIDLIYSAVLIDENGQRQVADLDSQADIFSQWLTWQLPQTGGCLWRKQALEGLGGWNEEMPCCQEHELYLRAIQAGLSLAHAPSALAVYRIWSDQTLCRKDSRLVVEVKTALIDKLHGWLSERGLWTQNHARLAGRACFEMARTLAKEDVLLAAEYHAARVARGMIHLAGPAAPLAYRIAYRTAGFSAAEKLAATRRTTP